MMLKDLLGIFPDTSEIEIFLHQNCVYKGSVYDAVMADSVVCYFDYQVEFALAKRDLKTYFIMIMELPRFSNLGKRG